MRRYLNRFRNCFQGGGQAEGIFGLGGMVFIQRRRMWVSEIALIRVACQCGNRHQLPLPTESFPPGGG